MVQIQLSGVSEGKPHHFSLRNTREIQVGLVLNKNSYFIPLSSVINPLPFISHHNFGRWFGMGSWRFYCHGLKISQGILRYSQVWFKFLEGRREFILDFIVLDSFLLVASLLWKLNILVFCYLPCGRTFIFEGLL